MKDSAKLLFISMWLMVSAAEAAVCTSIATGNWNATGTWSCTAGTTTPATDDTVILASPYTVSLNNNNRTVASLTIEAGATLNDDGQRLTVAGNVVNNGVFGTHGGTLRMTGANATLTGTGTFNDTDVEIEAVGISLAAGSTMEFANQAQLHVGNNNTASFTLDGAITGNGLAAGDRILSVYQNSSMTINGSITAPNAYVRVEQDASVTNNGVVSVRYLDSDGNNPTSVWTQGANSSLTLAQTPANSWRGSLNASATGNTLTFNGSATPFTPETYYNLAGTGVTCPLPADITVLGSSPCMAGLLTVTASPTLCVNDNSNGGTQVWSGLTNVGSQNNVYAQASGVNGQVTNYLKCTGYNFSIPAGAIIKGITVGVWRYSNRIMSDQAMQLVKASGIQSTDLATSTTFPAINTQVLYGGATTLWGTSWTPAEINDAGFGAAFAAVRGPYTTTGTAFVDYMPITVAYTLGVPPALAEYRMDEAGWIGTSNEVQDSSGNGNHAQSFNSANTSVTTPAIAGSPGTCRYGVFDDGTTTITQGYVQTPLPNLTTDFTITAWMRTASNTVSGQRILIDDQSNSGGYGFSLADGVTGRLRFYSRAINPIILDSTYTIANNTWYFVAAVADITNRRRTIYVFNAAGALLNSTTEAAWLGGTWGTDNGPVSIGAETNASGEAPPGFHFHGNLDEVRVYQNALSQSMLAAIATQTHACAVVGPHHIRVQHDGNGLTCTPETLTVIACANATCTAPHYADAVAGNVTWGGAPGGVVAFNITTGGMTTVNLPVTTPHTVTLGTGAVSPVPLSASDCVDLSGVATCNLPFADSGLLVSVPNHVSETAQSMTISAVRKSDNALDCVPAFMSVPRTISLNCAYANPVAGTLPVRVAGAALNAANNTASACDATGQTPTLAFDANGTATATLQYADAGQMTINASYAGSAATGDAGLVMTGSDTFIAAPASFAFSGVTAAPIKAGNAFTASVTAMNAAGNPTPSFGKESSPESVTLSFTKCQPTGTNSSGGSFSGSVGTFSAGAASATNLTWSEVGNIDLIATLSSGDYLSSGLTASGNTGTSGTTCNTSGAGNVGSFIPDHFDTTVTGPMTCPSGQICPAGRLVYSGQSFTANVYARNAAGGTTQNYDGTVNTSPNFAKAVTLYAWDGPGSTATQNPPSTDPGSITGTSDAISAGSFNMGTTAFPGVPGAPIYAFGTTPTNPTDIYIRATDTDGVTSLRASNPTTTSVEGGVKVVSGRIKVSNAYGSEQLPLPVNAMVQYWNGAGWMTSATDSVTAFNPATQLVVAPVKGPLVAGDIGVTDVGAVTVAGGIRAFKIDRPEVSGSADIRLSSPAYLLSVPGRVTFGVYKGANQFIYQREAY